MDIPSLEVFRNCIDVALRDMVSGHDGLMVGLDDLSGLFQPHWFYDSMILSNCPGVKISLWMHNAMIAKCVPKCLDSSGTSKHNSVD